MKKTIRIVTISTQKKIVLNTVVILKVDKTPKNHPKKNTIKMKISLQHEARAARAKKKGKNEGYTSGMNRA